MKVCSISDCGKQVWCRGWCHLHYDRWNKHGDPMHKKLMTNKGLTCYVDGCKEPSSAKGLCTVHYRRQHFNGDAQYIPTRRAAGLGTVTPTGYVKHRSDGEVGKFEHHIVAEKALGKKLPRKAVVHHVDHNPLNNAPNNLVICPNRAYHNLLHQRERALDACGNANWRKCYVCKAYDDPASLKISDSGAAHAECLRIQGAIYRENRA